MERAINIASDRIVCACYRVRESEIRSAVEQNGLATVREVMRCTNAGDACTSCHTQIELIIEDCSTRSPACCRQSAPKGNSPTQSF